MVVGEKARPKKKQKTRDNSWSISETWASQQYNSVPFEQHSNDVQMDDAQTIWPRFERRTFVVVEPPLPPQSANAKRKQVGVWPGQKYQYHGRADNGTEDTTQLIDVDEVDE